MRKKDFFVAMSAIQALDLGILSTPYPSSYPDLQHPIWDKVEPNRRIIDEYQRAKPVRRIARDHNLSQQRVIFILKKEGVWVG
jgi:hypothetical protein